MGRVCLEVIRRGSLFSKALASIVGAEFTVEGGLSLACLRPQHRSTPFLMPGCSFDCDSSPFPLPDPLPPEELSLSNRGHSTSLYASWKGAPAVSIIHYRGVLFETKSQVQIRNVSLEKSWTNITFEGLSPGLQYTLEMTAVAGPYKSPMCTAMDWTCEYVTSTELRIVSPSQVLSVHLALPT